MSCSVESPARGNVNLDFRRDLFSDSIWGFNMHCTFDTVPESETASNGGYGIVTTVGRGFHFRDK